MENWCIKNLRKLPDDKGPITDLNHWRGYINGLLYALNIIKTDESNQIEMFGGGK